MGDLDLNNAQTSDMENRVDNYEFPTLQLDNARQQKETFYQNSKWSTQWGAFNTNPDLKSAIMLKAIFNVGKGYTTDIKTKVILDYIRGWGKDTFDDILYNMEIIKRVGGDSFAEIIWDDYEKDDRIPINIKPLDPSTIRIVVNEQGVIQRYEQLNRTDKNGTASVKFKPDEILHFSNNRLADQIHGISDLDVYEETLIADNESFADMRKIMHRQARPLIMFKLESDDTATIDAFATKMDKAVNKGENIYIPNDKNTVDYEVVQVQVSPIVLEWRNEVRKRFYRGILLPELIPSGGGDATESGGKIGSLHFAQIIEKEQRQIERQIEEQLNLKIDLIPPETLSSTLAQDAGKDGSMQQMNFQPSDATAGVGR